MKSLTKTFTVESKDTAARVGSGGLEVLATPTMIAWMENTALELAGQDLSSEDTSPAQLPKSLSMVANSHIVSNVSIRKAIQLA